MDKFKKMLKKFKIKSSVAAVALVVIGLLFIIFPNSSANIICYVAGAFILVAGLLCLVSFFSTKLKKNNASDLVMGITLISIALLLLIKPWVISGFLTVIIGIALIVDGAIKLQQFFLLSKRKRNSCWLAFALSAVYLVLGYLIVFNPFDANVLMLFVGISLVAVGVSDMLALGLIKNVAPDKNVEIIDLDDSDIHFEEENPVDGERKEDEEKKEDKDE